MSIRVMVVLYCSCPRAVEYIKECLVSITVTVDTDAFTGDGAVSHTGVLG